MGKVPPAVRAMRVDLGMSLIESGFIHTMMYTVGAVLGVFGGAAADRFGQKRFALIGLALMVAGGVLGALAWSYALLLASRFLEGVGFILLTVAAAPLLTAATLPGDRATAFSIWSCYMPAGGALVMLAAPLALATLGWRGLWLGLAGYTAACALVLSRWVPVPAFRRHPASLPLPPDSLTPPGIPALC